MGWMDRFRFTPATQKSSLANPTADLLALFSALPSAAGVVVNSETALRSPTVFAATRAIAETAGMLPIAVRRRKGEGWTKITDHPASKVLNGFANPWTSSEQLRTALIEDAILHRNGGFAKVVRVNGDPCELHRLSPTSVRIKVSDETGEPVYEVNQRGGGTLSFGYTDIIHMHVPGWTIDRPLGLIDLAKDAIAVDIAMWSHLGSTFKSGAIPRAILSPEFDSTPDALLEAVEFLARQVTADRRFIILPKAFKSDLKTFTLSELQFVELLRLVSEKIAGALKVPGTIVGDLSKGTYANTEQQNRAFLQLCLLPWLEMEESALTRCLIPPDERENVELEFITEDLLRGDTAARATAFRQATGGAWMLRNEARALDGMPPVAGGDQLLNQAGQAPAGPKPAAESE